MDEILKRLAEIEARLAAATPGECRQDGLQVHSDYFHTAKGIAFFAFERDAELFARCRRDLEWATETMLELMAEREAH